MPPGLCPLGAGSQAGCEAAPYEGFAASVATFVLESKPQNLFFCLVLFCFFLRGQHCCLINEICTLGAT